MIFHALFNSHRYNTEETHERHPINHTWGWDMVCTSWVRCEYFGQKWTFNERIDSVCMYISYLIKCLFSSCLEVSNNLICRLYAGHIHGINCTTMLCTLSRTRISYNTLHWRHNDHDGVWNHQPHGCLFNRLFRRRSKKTSKLRVTGPCVGNSPGPVNSPHKGPVMRKMFPFDENLMMFHII